jgi:hypothetical protein
MRLCRCLCLASLLTTGGPRSSPRAAGGWRGGVGSSTGAGSGTGSGSGACGIAHLAAVGEFVEYLLQLFLKGWVDLYCLLGLLLSGEGWGGRGWVLWGVRGSHLTGIRGNRRRGLLRGDSRVEGRGRGLLGQSS